MQAVDNGTGRKKRLGEPWKSIKLVVKNVDGIPSSRGSLSRMPICSTLECVAFLKGAEIIAQDQVASDETNPLLKSDPRIASIRERLQELPEECRKKTKILFMDQIGSLASSIAALSGRTCEELFAEISFLEEATRFFSEQIVARRRSLPLREMEWGDTDPDLELLLGLREECVKRITVRGQRITVLARKSSL